MKEHRLRDRKDIVTRFESLAGPFKARTAAPEFKVVSKRNDGIAAICKIYYSVDAPYEVPALLLWPCKARSVRPCLALHQTTVPTRLGKEEPAGLAGREDMKYGLELARRGFAVLCPDYPLFGEYELDIEKVYGDYGYESMSMKGVNNHIAGLDVLAAIFGVRLERAAAIGHSLGGTNAIYLACFDDRIGAVVSSCGFTDFRAMAESSKTRNLTSIARREKYLPLIESVFDADYRNMPVDFGDLLGLLAPRAAFFNTPKRDEIHGYEGAMRALSVAEKAYIEAGVRERLFWTAPDAGHDFPSEIRKQAYAFAEAWTDPIDVGKIDL